VGAEGNCKAQKYMVHGMRGVWQGMGSSMYDGRQKAGNREEGGRQVVHHTIKAEEPGGMEEGTGTELSQGHKAE